MNSLQQKRVELETAVKRLEESVQNNVSNGSDLQQRLVSLRRKLTELFEETNINEERNQQEIRRLNQEVFDLQKKLEMIKCELDQLKEKEAKTRDEIDQGQLMYLWDFFLPRFVISKEESLPSMGGWYKRMKECTEKNGSDEEVRWSKILRVLGIPWTRYYRSLINNKRNDRNITVHPHCLNLDDLQTRLTAKTEGYEKERLVEIIKMLKLTASLMKFEKMVSWSRSAPIRWTEEEVKTIEMMDQWNHEFSQLRSSPPCITFDDAQN